MDRHQLDDGDSELLQIRNLFDQPGKRTAFLGRNAARLTLGEASDVHLLNNGVGIVAGSSTGYRKNHVLVVTNKRLELLDFSHSSTRASKSRSGRVRKCL